MLAGLYFAVELLFFLKIFAKNLVYIINYFIFALQNKDETVHSTLITNY